MEIHQLISKLQTPSKEEIRYKVGEVLGKSPTSEVEQALRLIYADEIRKRGRQFVEDDNTRTKIAQTAKWICESPRKGLMLYGNVGAGKTMLLNSLIRLFREVGYWHPKLFAATAIDLCQYFRKDETEGHYREAVKSEILMIDDLGCEPEVCMIYGVKHTPIQNLLYDRYRFQRTIVITSNLTDKELLERYGIRMKDRMDETFDFITFSNQSYRKHL